MAAHYSVRRKFKKIIGRIKISPHILFVEQIFLLIAKARDAVSLNELRTTAREENST
jgi:hypothetical protein